VEIQNKKIGASVLVSQLRMMLKLGTLESRSEMPWKFCNEVLEKDGEERLHHLCEK
jgi:hypothetical protein